jgi:beta-carotene 3-hydroxylase
MQLTLANIAFFAATFIAMEFVAWWLHKYVMHGFLWTIHKSHHVKEEGFFERNDLFFLFFAIPGAYFIASGIIHQNFQLYIGAGIAVYGLVYFLVHDVFIHQRYPFLKRSRNRYFRALRRAHHAHHKHLGKEHGESFGLLLVRRRYFES